MSNTHTRRNTTSRSKPEDTKEDENVTQQAAPQPTQSNSKSGMGIGTVIFAFAVGGTLFYAYSLYSTGQVSIDFSGMKLGQAAPITQAPITPPPLPSVQPPEFDQRSIRLQRQLAEVDLLIEKLEKRHTMRTQELETQNTLLNERIAKLETALATTSNTDHEAVSALNEKLETITSELSTLKTAQSKQASAHSAMVDVLKQAELLEDALRDGTPYTKILDKLSALTTEHLNHNDAMETLRSHSETGILTHQELVNGYREMAAIAVPLSIANNEEAKLSDKLRSSLGHVISIRKVGANQSGKSDEAIIARAEAAIEQDDVKSALEQMSSLSEAGMISFTAWVEQANAYQETWEALEDIRTALYATSSVTESTDTADSDESGV